MIIILFLASNPSNTRQLAIDRESRSIKERLRATSQSAGFCIEQEESLRVRDLTAALLRHQPEVVHFSGHGNAEGALIVEDQQGQAVALDREAVDQLFAEFSSLVKCVVLNACHTEAQAQLIARHIDCVVGVQEAISDETAATFAAAFYQAIGYGQSIGKAYRLAVVETRLGTGGDRCPLRLCTRAGVNADEVFLRFIAPSADSGRGLSVPATPSNIVAPTASHARLLLGVSLFLVMLLPRLFRNAPMPSAPPEARPEPKTVQLMVHVVDVAGRPNSGARIKYGDRAAQTDTRAQMPVTKRCRRGSYSGAQCCRRAGRSMKLQDNRGGGVVRGNWLMWWTVLVVANATVFLPIAVQADSDSTAKAKEHYERGLSAYGLGRFAEAADEYEASFNLKPDPALLYNAAQARRLSGDLERALRLYQSCEQIFGSQLPNLDTVKSHIAELKQPLEEHRRKAAAMSPVPALPPGREPPAPRAAAPPTTPRAAPWMPAPSTTRRITELKAATAASGPAGLSRAARAAESPAAPAEPVPALRHIDPGSSPAAPLVDPGRQYQERQARRKRVWIWGTVASVVVVGLAIGLGVGFGSPAPRTVYNDPSPSMGAVTF